MYLKKDGSLRTAPVPKEKTGRKWEEPDNFNVDDDTLPATQLSLGKNGDFCKSRSANALGHEGVML